jgi:predicted dinucleotide-binding enzyme
MDIAVIGPGRIGGNIAERLVRAGHIVAVAFSRDPRGLAARASAIGAHATTPADAVEASDVVVLSVPWDAIPDALAQAGPLDGRVVVDTTNQYGRGVLPAPGQTAAAFNAARMPDARYTKSFNTLTSGFQRAARPEVVQWICGDDPEAKEIVAGLVRDVGYTPVDLGGTADCAVMEAPRRPGAVYGEEYREPDASAVVEAVRAGRPIPPTPAYVD